MLNEAGLTKETAADWQRVASIPQPAYEAYKAESRAKGEITEKGALAPARVTMPTEMIYSALPNGSANERWCNVTRPLADTVQLARVIRALQ